MPLRSPLPAVEFLTTLRLHLAPVRASTDVAGALWAFPFVGLLIGLALFGLERGARELAPPTGVGFVVVVAWVGLTGGLHLDGLADACDGLFGGRTRDARLAIMHDVQTGTWGVIALVLALLGKFAAVLAVAEDGRFGALLLAPIVARGLIVGAMATVPYARPDGYGRELHAAARGLPALVAVGAAVAAGGVLFGAEGIAVVAVVGVALAGAVTYATARIGGLTGDLDGALIEITEIVTLLAVATALDQAWITPLLWDGG